MQIVISLAKCEHEYRKFSNKRTTRKKTPPDFSVSM